MCAFPEFFSFEFQRIFTRFFPEKNDKSHVFQEKTRKKRVKTLTKNKFVKIYEFIFFKF